MNYKSLAANLSSLEDWDILEKILKSKSSKELFVNKKLNILRTFSRNTHRQHLISILLQAEKHIKRIFSNETLELKVIYDPEIPNWEKLFILIKTKLDADQAFDKLQQLDQTWWLEASYLAKNDLEIHIEFDEI